MTNSEALDLSTTGLRETHRIYVIKAVAGILVFGGIFGVVEYVWLYFNIFNKIAELHAHLSLGGGLGLVVFTSAFILSIWSGIRLWVDRRDWHGTARGLIAAQIVSFTFDGFGYVFHIGLNIDAGLKGEQLGFFSNLGSHAAVLLGDGNDPKSFVINVGAVVMLALLGLALSEGRPMSSSNSEAQAHL